MSDGDVSSVRLAATPAVTGLVAGLALAGVWSVTAPRIEAHRLARLESSVRTVLPAAQATRGFVVEGERFTPVEPGAPADLWAGWDAGGAFVGWAVPAEGGGYQDTIRVLFGLDPRRSTILGMEVLESRETPGLGDRIYKDEAFVAAFRGLSADPLPRLVKTTPEAPGEVQALTGATISSSAVVRMIAEATGAWQPRLANAAEPDPPSAATSEDSP